MDNFPLATTGTGRAAWNEWTGATWQLTEVGNGNFVLVHLIATNDINNPVMALVGQAEYSNAGDAQEAASSEISTLALGGLEFLYTEWTEIGTLIFQTSNGYTNSVKSRIRETADGGDYLDFRGGVLGGGGAASAAETIKPFILMPSVYDVMDDDMVILDVVVPESFTIPSGMPQSSGRVFGTTATGSTVISILKNDVQVATITFAGAATAATVAAAADALFVAGVDRITIKGPATADATLAGFTLAVRGLR